MVSDHISVVYSSLGHDPVVLRIDAVVPAYDVAETDSEGVVPVHAANELGHVLRLIRHVCKLAPLADLRVCNHDDVVVGGVLDVLLNDEVVLPDLVLDLLIEKRLSSKSR